MADHMPTTTVTLIARDLDTGKNVRREFQVPVPLGEAEEGARLQELVRREHPRAEMRSLADHGATFVDSDHLVIAVFDRAALLSARREARRLNHPGQQRFAA